VKIIPFLHSLIGFVVTVNNAINIRVFLTIIVIIIIVVIHVDTCKCHSLNLRVMMKR